ncbi:MAG TPA: isoamylase early set domain-containing protein [Gemmatimonadaceae bacterium]
MSDERDSLDPYVQWIVSEARRSVAVDPAARHRLLEAIQGESRPERRSPVLAWLVQPRRFALPPLATAALAAGLVGIGVIGGLAIHRDGRLPTEQLSSAGAAHSQLPDSVTPRAVKFVLIAPQAARVALVGDFNGWDAAANPMMTQGVNGMWTVFVPLQPGLHTYSFVVDGAHFVADPTAPIAPDDGYGHKNSVVLVGGPSL